MRSRVGEALISCLDEQGTPQIVERGWVMPPYSSFTPITPEERQVIIGQSIVAGLYDQAVDRDSAYEMLQQKEAERIAKQREKLTQDIVGTFAKSAARSLGGSTGQKIVRGLLGSLFGKK